jgi:polysaccharide export outer membrane protein
MFPMFFSANQTIKSVEIEGMVNRPGQYFINEGETLSNLIERAGGLKNNAYLYGSALFRETARDQEKIFAQINYSDTVNFIISNAGKGNINKGILDLLNEELRSQNLPGRVVLDFKKSIYQDNKFVIENGDKIIIPALQKVVYLFGDFRKPSNLVYDPSLKVKDYLKLVGGVKDTAF